MFLLYRMRFYHPAIPNHPANFLAGFLGADCFDDGILFSNQVLNVISFHSLFLFGGSGGIINRLGRFLSSRRSQSLRSGLYGSGPVTASLNFSVPRHVYTSNEMMEIVRN